MANCSTNSVNSLDSERFEPPNIQIGSSCDSEDGYPSCDDPINICLCTTNIQPPPGPGGAKCVNDIIKRPWPPPPPANPGCNPFSVSVTSKQDTSVPATENIRLQGEVKYVGNDPCLPELNLELLVNPDFRAGGGTPVVKGWGVSTYGYSDLRTIRILPNAPEACAEYANPQEFLANEPGGEHFLPDDSLDCNSTLQACEYRASWADKVAKWGMIGPRLCIVTRYEEIASTTVTVINAQNEAVPKVVPYAWKYSLVPADCVKAAGVCKEGPGALEDTCRGYPFGPPAGGMGAQPPGIAGDTNAEFVVYNIKENVVTHPLNGHPILTPGVNLQYSVEAGLMPQPIALGTPVMAYGWVPWGSRTVTTMIPTGDTPQARCDCHIVWFIDIPNALAGLCAADHPTTLTSMLPTRKITSAGMFFGINTNANRV